MNILTSFPPRFYTSFVKRFESLHPEISISILNKKTTAAINEILRGNDRNFDIFWASSVDAFDILKSAHRLRRSEPQRDSPTVLIKDISLDDPEGYFYGFALSGVGWMWNSSYLKREKLPVPGSWSDLLDPRYYGHLAMSTPSRSGTTHLIVENLLQDAGWEKGWSQLLLMSGNFATVTARSFSVPEGVGSGRFGIGLVIDFLAQSQNKADLKFRYGQPVFLVPAGIGRLEKGLNAEEADLFLDFVLSLEGQKLLLLPGINRLPVSRELHADQYLKAPGLLRLTEKTRVQPYDVKLSRERYQLVNLLFDRLITFKLRERRHLWKRMVALEKRFGPNHPFVARLKKAVVKQLGAVPVSYKESQDPQLLKMMAFSSSDSAPNMELRKILRGWDAFVSANLGRVKERLDQVERSLVREQSR